MRVLFSTIGSRGDVQPVVALASHLKALGHQVRVCVPPDFREWIESLDIPVTPIGPEVRRFAASRPAATPPQKPLTAEQRRQMAEATVATQFEVLASAAQDCDVIVAATALQVAARSVAEKMGIAYVFAAYAPVVLPSQHHAPPLLPPLPGQAPPAANDNAGLWAQDAARFNDLFGAAVNARRASLGLAEIDDVRSHMLTDQPWFAADATLGPWPDVTDSRVFQTGAWILPDERPLSLDLETFLDRGDPPIYFGFGSTRAPEAAGPVMLNAARALGRQLVAGGGRFTC
ncbi:MAG: glycosyltransferase family 1 protein [Bryobacterales bacterium]|nr:glycosyltransferase family 1 protein [Bryobacterales bacterium]MBV9399535.1 glycosyltransferase family 1 protein [Bryobacterales bacterium]